jgi:hypothetical protein
MKPMPLSPRQTTAIPARFWRQRERVLKILARWERTADRASLVRA